MFLVLEGSGGPTVKRVAQDVEASAARDLC